MKFEHLYENLTSVGAISGSYVGRKMDQTSRQLIMILQKELGLGQHSVKEEDLHITLMYSKGVMRFPFMPDQKSIKSEIAETAELAWFGERGDCLVLKFDCPKLKARHNEISTYYNVKHTFDPYKAHVTLAYDVPNPTSIDTTKGILPAYLRFIAEYYEDLDLDWKKKRA